MTENKKYTEIMKQLNYQPIGSVLLRLYGVVKRLWNKLTIIIIYVPSLLIDYLISLTTDESYSDARKTTMRSFKRVWYNK
jgi:hypothetical protein